MTEEELRNPWCQKLALIESLTPEQMIQVYSTEFPAILSCSKIPEAIVRRVVSGRPVEGVSLMREQLHLVCNKHIGVGQLQEMMRKTPFDWICEMAVIHINLRQNCGTGGP